MLLNATVRWYVTNVWIMMCFLTNQIMCTVHKSYLFRRYTMTNVFLFFFFINYYRSLCSTLLSAQINLLAYFQCLMELLPENQRIEIGKNSKMHFSVKGRTFIASNEN